SCTVASRRVAVTIISSATALAAPPRSGCANAGAAANPDPHSAATIVASGVSAGLEVFGQACLLILHPCNSMNCVPFITLYRAADRASQSDFPVRRLRQPFC